MAYPTTIESPDVTMQGTTLFTGDDHALAHRTAGSAVIDVQNWLGTNAASNGIFNSYTAGQVPLPIKSGTLGTAIANGTINNSTFGTPNVTNGTLTAPTLAGVITNNGTISGGMLGTNQITGGTETATLRILGSNAYSPAVSATGTIDLATGNRFLVTLGNSAGSTGLAIKNSVANQPFLIEILQGTAGNGTVNWFGSINWLNSGTSAPTQGTTPSLKQTFGFITTGVGTFDGYSVGGAS